MINAPSVEDTPANVNRLVKSTVAMVIDVSDKWSAPEYLLLILFRIRRVESKVPTPAGLQWIEESL